MQPIDDREPEVALKKHGTILLAVVFVVAPIALCALFALTGGG